jgi:hypothetical protein
MKLWKSEKKNARLKCLSVKQNFKRESIRFHFSANPNHHKISTIQFTMQQSLPQSLFIADFKQFNLFGSIILINLWESKRKMQDSSVYYLSNRILKYNVQDSLSADPNHQIFQLAN